VTENAVDAAIQVQRVGGSSGTLTATVSTLPGTALAGSDYTATTATVNFANGDAATKNVLVPIISDAVNETAETFTVALSGPTGSTGSPNTATVTIVDDDPLPLLSIDDIVVLEGDSGVSLSGISSQTITVGYATADGSAVAPSDYTTTSGTLIFPAGTTSQTIAVVVNGDAVIEADETFLVNLSAAANAIIADPQGLGSIGNDDGAATISIDDISVPEGATNAVFTITVAGTTSQTLSVDYATSNGSASAGSDFIAAETIIITVRSGALIVYGATTDNVTNDPAIHFARRFQSGADRSALRRAVDARIAHHSISIQTGGIRSPVE
jgi:hypothetical protein